MNATHHKDDRHHLGDLAGTAKMIGLGMAGLGVVGAVIFWLAGGLDIDQLTRGWLVAFCFGLTISLGGLFWTMVQHATRAGWSVAVRRISEAVAANLKWIWILFIPILIAPFTTHIYHWMHPVLEDGSIDPILLHKIKYFFGFNPVAQSAEGAEMTSHFPTFWLVRAVAFFVIWFLLARFFHGTSVKQDASGDPSLTSRMQWWAPLGLLAYALTQTFASFDWIMSLEAHWFSTMFGVYFFAGSCCASFATYIIIAAILNRKGKLVNEVNEEHFQDLGKLLFAFGVVFWAYISFSQYMLIWYANIPEETGWFLTRQIEGWQWLGVLLIVGHFAIPFLLLVTKHTKRIIPVVALIALYMLVMHTADLIYMIMPTIPAKMIENAASYEALVAEATPADVGLNGMQILYALSLVVAMAGLLVTMTTRTLAQHALLPVHDPRLPESIAFENM